MTSCCLCNATVPVWLRIESRDYLDHRPYRSYLAKYVGKALCTLCVTRLEIEHIAGIPLEDLPLLINVKWISAGGTIAYQARLSGNPIKYEEILNAVERL